MTAGLKLVRLNPMDQERRNLVTQFRDKLQINYELLFTSSETAEHLRLKIYSTLYLIKTAQIVYSKIGYREEDIFSLEEHLQNHLKKNDSNTIDTRSILI